MKQRGFTLIELLIVVSLIIIVVGVTGDIIVSLVRSYSKTQITNEVEQNANFVMTKLEKELKNASSVTNVGPRVLTFIRKNNAGVYETITYTIKDTSTIVRQLNAGPEIILINNVAPYGVQLDLAKSSFSDDSVAGGPKVIRIKLSFRQLGTTLVQFTQDIDLESVIVVRGTY